MLKEKTEKKYVPINNNNYYYYYYILNSLLYTYAHTTISLTRALLTKLVVIGQSEFLGDELSDRPCLGDSHRSGFGLVHSVRRE